MPNNVNNQGPVSESQAAARHDSFSTNEPVSPRTSVTHHKSETHDFLSILGMLGGALILAFLIISFVFQSYQVDGPSMQTTLEHRDHLIVWKVPKTIASLTHHRYLPHRGDIIIFSKPGATNNNEQLIKRVIALPGEHIVVKDGAVTVYNQEHPDGFNPDKALPYGKAINQTPNNVDINLQANEIFVMGDHRDNSRDSRDFGPITSEQIVGKLALRVSPLNKIQSF